MKYTVEEDFRHFEPWSGAVDTFNAILDAGKEDEADAYFTELEPPEGWTDTDINDILWHDSDNVLQALGIRPSYSKEYSADEIVEEWAASFNSEKPEGNAKPIGVEIPDDETFLIRYLDDNGDEDETVLSPKDIAEMMEGEDCEIDVDKGIVYVW